MGVKSQLEVHKASRPLAKTKKVSASRTRVVTTIPPPPPVPKLTVPEGPWWKAMTAIAKKHSDLIRFERLQDGRFVEDCSELAAVGAELLAWYGAANVKRIRRFLDVCAAPGMYSRLILTATPYAKGVGLSLPTSKGGVPYALNGSLEERYGKRYVDITSADGDYGLQPVDFAIASCVSYNTQKSKQTTTNAQLSAKSVDIMLRHLSPGGDMIVNLTLKDVNLAYNTVTLLARHFKTFSLWKSSSTWQLKNTFYFIGYGRVGEVQTTTPPRGHTFVGTREELVRVQAAIEAVCEVRHMAFVEASGVRKGQRRVS